MSESDQRQQLINKIHSTSNTKKGNQNFETKKSKIYSCEEAKTEEIVKTLGLALSRYAKELKRIPWLVLINLPN